MPFAFIHIPKTAGRAFRGIVQTHTGVKTAPHRLMAHYYQWPIEGYEFYGGHTFYQSVKKILPEDTKYMVLLRDPINRIYSHWLHILREEVAHMYGLEKDPTFSEFIRCPETRVLASNFQCRYLTIDPGPSLPPGPEELALDWQISVEQEVWKWEVIDDAIQTLNEFALVGTQEKFVSSIMTACMIMGYLPPTEVPQIEKDYYDLISEEDLEFLMAANVADWTVYNEFK